VHSCSKLPNQISFKSSFNMPWNYSQAGVIIAHCLNWIAVSNSHLEV
jgi:hypothetical protein